MDAAKTQLCKDFELAVRRLRDWESVRMLIRQVEQLSEVLERVEEEV